MNYGLQEFGDFDYTAVNNKLAKALIEVYGDQQELGAMALTHSIEELSQKVHALQNGKSAGFRMFTLIGDGGEKQNALTKKVFEILSEVWECNVSLENGILTKAKDD